MVCSLHEDIDFFVFTLTHYLRRLDFNWINIVRTMRPMCVCVCGCESERICVDRRLFGTFTFSMVMQSAMCVCVCVSVAHDVGISDEWAQCVCIVYPGRPRTHVGNQLQQHWILFSVFFFIVSQTCYDLFYYYYVDCILPCMHRCHLYVYTLYLYISLSFYYYYVFFRCVGPSLYPAIYRSAKESTNVKNHLRIN